MIALELVMAIAGLCYVLGARETALNLLKDVGVSVVLLAVLPCVLASFHGDEADPTGGALLLVFAFAFLAVVGYIAWKRRASRQKAAESWRKRHLHPRRRALPRPPVRDAEP